MNSLFNEALEKSKKFYLDKSKFSIVQIKKHLRKIILLFTEIMNIILRLPPRQKKISFRISERSCFLPILKIG